MRRCFAVVALFAAVVISAAETAVLKFAENSTVAVMEINVQELMKHPEVAKLLNEPESLNQRAEIARKTGVRLEDFKKLFVLINSEGKFVVVVNVDKKFNAEQIFLKNNVKFKKKVIAGKQVIQLEEQMKNGKRFEFFTLAPGMIFAGENGSAVRYLNSKRGRVSRLVKVVRQIPADVPVWLAFINTVKNARGGIDDPLHLYFTFRFSGAKMRDLDFRLVLDCAAQEGAARWAGMAPLYARMGLAFVFGNDPELNKKVSDCINVKISGNRVSVSSYIPEDLVKEISVFLQNNSDKFIKQGMNAAGGQEQAAPVPAEKNKIK